MKLDYEGKTYDCDDELSGRDFTGLEFASRPELDFSNKIIYATCFGQESPDQPIFGDKLTGATFIRCNLTNVLVPDGNTLIDCITTRCATQNDGRVWEIDESNTPVRLTSEKHWRILGTSVDPADIPQSKLVLARHETLETKLAEMHAAKEALSQ